MQARTLNDLRARTEDVLNEAEDEPVLIARDGREPVVLVSRAEWESLNETVHVLGSVANAERLGRSMADVDAIERSVAIAAE